MLSRPASVSSKSRIPSISEEHEEDHSVELSERFQSRETSGTWTSRESLEGSLYQKKYRGMGGWKRRYVKLNMSDGGSLSCHHTTGTDKKALSSFIDRSGVDDDTHSLDSKTLTLHFSSDVDWTARDVESSSSFIVDVDTHDIGLKETMDDENDGDDDVSVASSAPNQNNSRGLDKYLSKADSSRLNFVFRCPRGPAEKSLWIEAFVKLGRLMASDSGTSGAQGSPSFFARKRISGRERSALASQMAREKMNLLGHGKSSTAAALSEAEDIARKVQGDDVEFTVQPSYAYPNVRFNRDELRLEMKKPSSHFHDLRVPSKVGEEIGTLRVEVLQCLGLPKLDLVGETDPVVYLVCGAYAFSTDTIPDVANPMWLSKMRRACIFPLFHAYARLYVGVFDNDGEKERDDFAGRVVVDIARLRHSCTYDVTLPLRESAHVYTRRQRGSVRLRFRIDWKSERSAMLSYLPKKLPKLKPNRSTTVRCYDETAFQNLALTVHGKHMQGHFSFKQLKATMREINFTRIMIIRLILRPEAKKIVLWENPVISLFVFAAWMHCVYQNSVAYVPGHLLTFLLLYLWKNYARYGMDGPGQRGFLPPTWEEMMSATMYGGSGHNPPSISPLDMQVYNPVFNDSSSSLMSPQGSLRSTGSFAELSAPSEDENSLSLREIAERMRAGVPVQTYKHRLRSYKNVFTGIDGVDFLVNSNIARSRKDAVRIGRALVKSYRLFEHVKKEHSFKDEKLFYRFLDVSLEKYVFTTHQPKGKNVLRMLGLYDDSYVNNVANNGHLEFPFSDFVEDYPKFSVKESLVSRLSSEKKMRRMSALQLDLLDSDDDDDGEIEAIEQLGDSSSVLDEFMASPNGKKESEDDMDKLLMSSSKSFGRANSEAGVAESTPPSRRPPPPQNMDVVRKSEKKLTDELQKVKGRLNAILFHWFNDKVYDIKYPNAKFSRSSSRRRKVKKRQVKEDTKTQLDRSLQCGQFSHSNKAVAKVGMFIEPIVGIALIFLQGIRALYNIFTWRDPILSFWVSVVAPAVAVVLHFFPWRPVLFVVGFLIVGPQNFVIRLFLGDRIGRYMNRPKPEKVKKSTGGTDQNDEPFFQSNVSGNSQSGYRQIDPTKVHHIVVPYSPLMYQRFYDWPPEPEYAKVEADSTAPLDDMQSTMVRSQSSRPTFSPGSSTLTKSPKRDAGKPGIGALSKIRRRGKN